MPVGIPFKVVGGILGGGSTHPPSASLLLRHVLRNPNQKLTGSQRVLVKKELLEMLDRPTRVFGPGVPNPKHGDFYKYAEYYRQLIRQSGIYKDIVKEDPRYDTIKPARVEHRPPSGTSEFLTEDRRSSAILDVAPYIADFFSPWPKADVKTNIVPEGDSMSWFSGIDWSDTWDWVKDAGSSILDSAVKGFASGIGSGIQGSTQRGYNQIVGYDPAQEAIDQQGRLYSSLFPGTTPWERLGSSAASGGTQQLNTKEQLQTQLAIARMQTGAQVEIAKIQAGETRHRTDTEAGIGLEGIDQKRQQALAEAVLKSNELAQQYQLTREGHYLEYSKMDVQARMQVQRYSSEMFRLAMETLLKHDAKADATGAAAGVGIGTMLSLLAGAGAGAAGMKRKVIDRLRELFKKPGKDMRDLMPKRSIRPNIGSPRSPAPPVRSPEPKKPEQVPIPFKSDPPSGQQELFKSGIGGIGGLARALPLGGLTASLAGGIYTFIVDTLYKMDKATAMRVYPVIRDMLFNETAVHSALDEALRKLNTGVQRSRHHQPGDIRDVFRGYPSRPFNTYDLSPVSPRDFR